MNKELNVDVQKKPYTVVPMYRLLPNDRET